MTLTLLARFGVLDVRHRLGAQGPHCDSQLPQRQGEVLVIFVDFFFFLIINRKTST